MLITEYQVLRREIFHGIHCCHPGYSLLFSSLEFLLLGTGVLTQLAKYLPSVYEAQASSPIHKLAMMVHACNPSTQEVKSVGLGVQDHSWIHNKFEASIGFVRACLQ